jgi:hypothetical protein
VKIFISHSTHDRWIARQLSTLLEAQRHSTFLDEKDIKTGESIDSTIQKHLKECDHLLLLLSPASVQSQWVLIELGGAKALGKHIVPVLHHVGSNEIPQAISQVLARELNDIDKYFAELKAVKSSAGKPGSITKATSGAAEPADVRVESGKPALKGRQKSVGAFAVGDRVRIISVEHLTLEDRDEQPKWVHGMDKFSGELTIITAFSPRGYAYLEISGDRFRWNLDWLLKAE